MVGNRALGSYILLSFLGAIPEAGAHEHDSHNGMATASSSTGAVPTTSNSTATMMSSDPTRLSYFSYPHHSSLMLAHVILMTLAWFFLLPIGVILNVSRSRFALLSQIIFLGLNAVALLFGTIYQNKTPELYEGNVHGSFGWLLTWIVVAQTMMVIVRQFGAHIPRKEQQSCSNGDYQAVTQDAMQQHQIHQPQRPDLNRYSHDSGHGTEPESSNSQSCSPIGHPDEDPFRKIEQSHDDEMVVENMEDRSLLRGASAVTGFLIRLNLRLSNRTLKAIDIISNLIDRVILLLGFLAITTGIVVYGGIFKGKHVFNGLAHFIKGGIFFWYGLLTLGRWMGCFSEYGWAWNVKPTVTMVGRRKAGVPSAEFVESFVIFLYGSTNVFLEHLAGWGEAWTAKDLEHVSISIMFFGGGLCGMLVESKKVRQLLNASISSINNGVYDHDEQWVAPKSYPFSLNPFPALIILLLGKMMSSHHQASMLSTMVHKQWGTLFVGFALARSITYLLTYLSPPTSYFPSRPPTELITSFCLIAGGIIFMASNKDTVAVMEKYDLDAMFVFTITMGFTAFLMAYTILVFTIRGLISPRRPATMTSWNRATQA